MVRTPVQSRKFGHSACVNYTVRVRRPDGSVRTAQARKRNLILDQGLDLIASKHWGQAFAYAAAGTGTDPVKRDSGAITVSVSSGVATASAGFFEAADVGRLIKLDSGEEYYVTAYNSTTSVDVTGADASASECTIWYVDRTGLTAEVKRTNTYGPDSGDNGSTWASPKWTLKRTFRFSAEVGSVTYNEVGWSDQSGSGANLFGMDIISGGVSLVASEQLEIVVELEVTLSPVTAQAYASSITGWSQPGDFGITDCRIGRVNSDGSSSGGTLLDPAVSTSQFVICADTTAIRDAANSNDDIAGASATATQVNFTGAAYTPGDYFRDFTADFTVNQANRSDLRSWGIGTIEGGGQWRRNAAVLVDASEEKTSDETLSITWRFSWGRTLTN